MSKRKRTGTGKTSAGADQPVGDQAEARGADDAAFKEDMAHVSPDVLAGSPDIFASKPRSAEEPAAPEASAEPVTAEPVTAEPATFETAPEAGEPPIENAELQTPVATEPAAGLAPAETMVPPPLQSPPHASHALQPSRPRAGSSAALGIVLVVVGLFALGIVLFGIDLTQYGWPLFVIIPGITLLVVGFLGAGSGASIPGGIVTMLGLVLAYQSSTGDWPSWAFAWALIVPGGVGLGLYLQALRDRNVEDLRRGRALMFTGALIFMIGFVFFESILGISGMDYGIVGKGALPALLIVIGIILLVRSVQRSRRA